MTKAVGFIGLGVMGFPMAGHLSEHNKIAVFNRTKTKSEIWSTKYKGKICSSPAELAPPRLDRDAQDCASASPQAHCPQVTAR